MTSRGTYWGRHVDWAGVAIRMSDGLLYAFEMNASGLITAEVSIERDWHDAYDSFGTDYIPPAWEQVRIELVGRATRSARFAGMADEARPPSSMQITEGQREIGDHARACGAASLGHGVRQ